VWQKWTNAHGGINGHPVKVITMDDDSNPAQALADTKQLVQGDHVQAIVGSVSCCASSAISSYVTQAGIPVIGGSTADLGTGPYFFPTAETLAAFTAGILQVAKSSGASKFGAINPIGAVQNLQQAQAAYTAAGNKLGLSTVYVTQVSPTAPDYSAPCLALISSGAEAAYIAVSPTVNQRVIQTCIQQGYKGNFALLSDFLTYPATNGSTAAKDFSGGKVYVQNYVWPWYDQKTQAQKDYFAAIAQYAPGMLTNVAYGPPVQEAWAGLQLFATAAKLGGIGPASTPADVTKAMYLIQNNNVGGLTVPLTFNQADKAHLVNCFFVTHLQGGQWVDALGGAPQCVTP